MPFTPKDWKNDPDTSTPISAEALEDLETRVTNYADSVGGGGGGALPAQQVLLSDYAAFDGTNQTTQFQAAADAAKAVAGELIIDGPVTLTGTVLIQNNIGSPSTRIGGYGTNFQDGTVTGSVIIDKNPSGPCLKVESIGVKSNRPHFHDFDVKLAVNKPNYNMVEIINNQTSTLYFDRVNFWGDMNTPYYARAGLHIYNTWNGRIADCKFQEILGYAVYMDNAGGFNGGNFQFDNVVDSECLNGMYITGAGTTNNVLFNNVKMFSAQVASHQYYEKRTTSLPASSATTIQLATGQDQLYFPPGSAVMIHSYAGTEIRRLISASQPYNTSTGVLSLAEPVQLSHNSTNDVRIICARYAVATGFYAPAMVFNCSHLEGKVACLFDSSSVWTGNMMSASLTANDSMAKVCMVGGEYSGSHVFNNCEMYSNLVMNEYRMVYGIKLDGVNGHAAVDIDQVGTYPPRSATQTDPKWQPCGGDSNFMTTGKYRVRVAKYGTEVNTIDAPPPDRFAPTAQPFSNVPRVGPTAINTISATSAGTLLLYLIHLPAGTLVSNISFMSGSTALNTAGSGPHAWVALYNGSRSLLGQSTDTTTLSWAANTVKTIDLATPYITTYSGYYYLGLMVHCGSTGTMPNFTGVNLGSTNLASLDPPVGGSANTGLGATAPGTAGSITQSSNIPWCAIG